MAAKSDKQWRNALHAAVKELVGDEMDNGKPTKALRLIARRVVHEAIGGNMMAVKEIGDRLDGRPAQIVQGDSDKPVEMVVRIVDATKD